MKEEHKKKKKFRPIQTIPDTGLISLGELQRYLRFESVETLVDVMPDGIKLTKLGTLKASLVKIPELIKGAVQTDVKNLKTPTVQEVPQVQETPQVEETPEPQETPVPTEEVPKETKKEKKK